MREILFRGKSKNNKQWAYGFYCLISNNHGMQPCIITGTERGCFIPVFVDPETVGEFTGILDRNGTKIFEGDVLASEAWACNIIVVWMDGGFTTKEGDSSHNLSANMRDADGFDIEDVEVIGNIHDNPELLEEEKPTPAVYPGRKQGTQEQMRTVKRRVGGRKEC